MNPFALNWLIRGLKGHSVTFAALFASFVLGWSISGELGRLLARLGVHWLYALLLPAGFFWWLAGREERFIPDERLRRRLARSLIGGALAVAVLIGCLR